MRRLRHPVGTIGTPSLSATHQSLGHVETDTVCFGIRYSDSEFRILISLRYGSNLR